MNTNKATALLIAALLACAACKAEQRDDSEPTEPPPTQTNAAPATAAQVAEPDSGDPSVPEAIELKTFGELVGGFQTATVTMSEKFPGRVVIDGQLDLAANQILALVDAVGADTGPVQGKVKCPMSYTFTFRGDDAEDLVLNAVCSGDGSTVVLATDSLMYRASNPAAVFELLESGE